jgi:hypothetical protein
MRSLSSYIFLPHPVMAMVEVAAVVVVAVVVGVVVIFQGVILQE